MTKSVGILLNNIGSPISVDLKDVRRYLGEFLMDPNVIDLPIFFRWLLVKGIVVNTRSLNSQRAYKKIWTKDGSPLIAITKKVAKKLQADLELPVALGMRYSRPNIIDGIRKLVDKGVNHIVFIPLYPHYAMSSFESSELFFKQALKAFNSVSFTILPPMYQDHDYIKALAEKIKPYFKMNKDHLVFSYHGLPLSHLPKTKGGNKHCLKEKNCCEINHACHQYCYRHQVYQTSRLVAESLKLERKDYDVAFQSRLNKNWLQPFTDVLVPELINRGKKNLVLVCPSFLIDCLETLEEIDLRLKQEALSLGVLSFKRVPCLNTDKTWLHVLKKKINESKKSAYGISKK